MSNEFLTYRLTVSYIGVAYYNAFKRMLDEGAPVSPPQAANLLKFLLTESGPMHIVVAREEGADEVIGFRDIANACFIGVYDAISEARGIDLRVSKKLDKEFAISFGFFEAMITTHILVVDEMIMVDWSEAEDAN